MGYYTNFELEILSGCREGLLAEVTAKLAIISEYDEAELFSEAIKWYEYEEHMLQMSLEYPETVFQLQGCGECGDEPWRLYVKNGKCQFTEASEASLVFDEYNENKL
jgi:hypothetical protein